MMRSTPAVSLHLKNIAEGAARSVSDFLRGSFRSNHEVSYKRDFRDVVTEADQEAERRIIEYILAHEPDSTILGEEGGQVGNGAVRWFIDPIDGTGNFSAGVAFWCVSIAAAIDGEVVAAVVYDPIAESLFAADLSGSTLNGQAIRAVGPTEEARAVLTTNYPAPRQVNRDGDRVVLLWGELVRSFFAVKRIGSAALSLCYVANGWYAATLSTAVNSWDVAAASFILKQAGGRYRPLMPLAPGQQDFHSSAYYGTVADADYPSLDRVCAQIVEIELEALTASDASQQ